MVYQFYYLTIEKQCAMLFLKDSLDVGWIYPYSFQFRSALVTIVALYLTSMYIYFLPVKSLHAKKRASINGTDSGMRTLTMELEVPSNPKRSTSPWLPLPMNCNTRLQPHGGRAQTRARTSQRREGSVPTNSDWHGALTFVKENLRELLNKQKSHKRNT